MRDIPGNVHAVLILSIPLLTLAVLFLTRRGSFHWVRIPLGGLAAFAVMAVGISVGSHKCGEGFPVNQWLVPSICAFFLVLIPKSKAVRWLSFLAALIIAALLTNNFVSLVHGQQYCGNPEYDATLAHLRQRHLTSTKDLLCERASTDKTIYPEGWMSDVLPQLVQKDSLTEHRYIITPLWHSAITHLHHKTTERLDYWFPGGTLQDSAGRIELRIREPH